MAASKKTSDRKPTFIFKGTIKKLKSATMKQVPVSERTAIVRVDQVIEAPPALTDYNGREITVELSGHAKVKAGQEMIFHTTSWIFGESIAVLALSQEPLKDKHVAMLAAALDPAQVHAQRQTRERFDDSDLVVSGKVVAVRLPAREVGLPGATPLASARSGSGPVSEHDPKWREAVVNIEEIHKGQHAKKQVVIRFPASQDVMWFSAPKFHPGQQGYFMLRRGEIKKPKEKEIKKTRATRSELTGDFEDAASQPYTALDQLDFQPYHEPGGIKNIIQPETLKKE